MSASSDPSRVFFNVLPKNRPPSKGSVLLSNHRNAGDTQMDHMIRSTENVDVFCEFASILRLSSELCDVANKKKEHSE